MSLDFMQNYARIRKQLYAPAPKPISIPRPKPIAAPAPVIKEPAPVEVVPEIRHRQCYIMPISGPCQPDHPYFGIYNGERDVLNIQSDAPKLKIDECVKFVVKQSGFSRTLLLGSQRTQDIVFARQQMMWIAKYYTGRSLLEIGRRLGGRDHTTILHGVRKLDALKACGEWVPPSIEDVTDFALRSRSEPLARAAR